MKTIGLLPNPMKDPDFSLSKKISNYLHSLGAQLYTNELYHDMAPSNVTLLPVDEIYKQCDCVITLGGDGTLLRAAQSAALANTPLLGINCGKIGYMAELEYNELDLLRFLIQDDFKVETRSMLSVSVIREGKCVFQSLALNDAVISRGAITRLIDMDVVANEQPIAAYSADGLIVSTPTGSTGYSLSAGGPILEPTSTALILTPICPHTLGVRPIVFASDSCIRITPINLVQRDAQLTVDGYQTLPLCHGDTIEIHRASHVTRLIKIKNLNFYHILNHKLVNGDHQR